MEELITKYIIADTEKNHYISKRDNYIFIDERYIKNISLIFSISEKDLNILFKNRVKNKETTEIFILYLENIPEIFNDVFSREYNYNLLLGLMYHISRMKLKTGLNPLQARYFKYLEELITEQLIENQKTVSFR